MKDKLLKEAEAIAAKATSWADLSNALFDPIDGIVSRAYPTKVAREAFSKTPTFQRIKELVSRAQEETGIVAGATPTKSGRFVLRLPKTLHAALETEAEAEGVSLNQLVVAKLSAQLGQLVQARKS